MKKMYKALTIATCMSLLSVGVIAQPVLTGPTAVNAVSPEGTYNTSAPRLNVQAPITRAEFIIAIMETTQESFPLVMDTHYAQEAMRLAAEQGLIDLEAYPEATWAELVTEDEKMMILGQAMQNEAFDMEQVYAKLVTVLISELAVNDTVLADAPFTHYQGHLMVPVRLVAEAMGYDVAWNQATYTATLTQGTRQCDLQVGYDAYGMNDTATEEADQDVLAIGVGPLLREGVMYVPVEAMQLFATTEIVSDTLYIDAK